MSNANINSFTLKTTFSDTDKIYVAQSPYGPTDDRAMVASVFLSTKQNSFNLSTYATSSALSANIDNTNSNSTWITSIAATKQQSVNLATYATSAALATQTGRINANSTWITSLNATKQQSVNLATYATSAGLSATDGKTATNSTNINNHVSSTAIHADHTAIGISGAAGLTGGGTITDNRTLTLAIDNLTEVPSVSKGVERIAVYDTVLAAHRYISANSLAVAGSGEANTGSNVNSVGIGVFNGKVSDDLQFKGIYSTTNRISISDITSTNVIDLTLEESNVDHNALANYAADQHREMATSTSTIVVWSGFHINSLLGTKVNTSQLTTYATSATVNDHISSIQLHGNHNSIFVDTSSGIAGGGDLTSTRSIYLDINGLTAITSVDPGADFLALHSTSITSIKKVKPFEMWGVMETTDVSTTTYSLQASDFGKNLRWTGTAAQTITIGNDADLSFPTQGVVMFTTVNTNGVTFTGGTSSTINNASGYTKTNSIYQMGGLKKDAAQTWIVWGLDA